MKRYKFIIALMMIGWGSLLSSCSDWLDYTPKDKQTYEQQFGTKSGFHSAVNGIYTNMCSTDLYGYNMSYGALDLMALLYNVSGGDMSYYNKEFKTATYSGEYASRALNSIWRTAYQTIMNVNLVLAAADEYHGRVLNEKEEGLIRGEMLAVRAFLHFDMLRLFGPIYKSEPNRLSIPYQDGTQAFRRDLMPADKVINDKLLPDLENAEALLAKYDPIIKEGVMNSGSEKGNWDRYRQLRMNYYAVILLKARVYLWKEDFESALNEVKKLTEDAKVKEHFPFVDPVKLLANTINPDRLFSTECLFGFYNKDMADIYKNTFNSASNGVSVLQPRKGYIDILFSNAGDYRRQSQWMGAASATGSEFDFAKYISFKPNKFSPEYWATFYGLMRLSEAYYIQAECLLNQNKVKEAALCLNVILKARGASELDAEKTNQKEVMKEIKKEYLREMRGEGQIFFLFKRFSQNFGQYSYGGEPELNGAEEAFFEEPSAEVRYNVPLPADETN